MCARRHALRDPAGRCSTAWRARRAFAECAGARSAAENLSAAVS
jgi:hypothetical protein